MPPNYAVEPEFEPKKTREVIVMANKGENIHAAARNGDVTSVELIISSNPIALNSRDKHSRTPLHLASWAGHTNVVNCLCKHKADVGAAAMDDMGAIHFATQKGHLEVVKTLVSAGVSIKAINRKGMTPLHFAVQGSHVDVTQYLLKKGANLNTKTKAGKAPIDFASNDEIRSLLLEHEKKANEVEDEKEKAASLENKDEGEESKKEAMEENPKRKGGDMEGEERELKPKKSKVALGHLVASDDTQEDYERQ